MDIPFSRWYPVIEKRRSRRLFDKKQPIELDTLSALEKVCREFLPFPNARSCLVTEPADTVFRGIIGKYGKIKQATAFVAFIGNMDGASVQEEVGYTGEGIILEATALGLSTCWVGGFFNPDNVASMIEIKSNERVLAITPVGYAHGSMSLEERIMTRFGHSHRRLPVSRLINGPDYNDLPDWVKTSIQAARLAPSAINRQPWRFNVEDAAITISIRTRGPEFNISKRLDCGIAMLYIELAAMTHGVRGQWQFLNSPQVARFSASV